MSAATSTCHRNAGACVDAQAADVQTAARIGIPAWNIPKSSRITNARDSSSAAIFLRRSKVRPAESSKPPHTAIKEIPLEYGQGAATVDDDAVAKMGCF